MRSGPAGMANPARHVPRPVRAAQGIRLRAWRRRRRRYTDGEARYVKGLLKSGGVRHLHHAAQLLHKWLAAGECRKPNSDTFYYLLAVRLEFG